MALSLDGTTGISATGNIISSGGIISATGNIYGGNIIGTIAPSAITVSGNATVGNLVTGGLVTATGNVTGGNINTGGLMSSTGNAIHGNILTAGVVSATGNINANYFIGNGSQLSGLSASKIFNGTSEANIGASGGNANITIGGTSNVVVVASTGVTINATAAAGSGVLIVSGNIQTSSSNATANIGNASNYFNRLFAQATTALYADLAEVYSSDAQYPPGTVLVFGGSQEVTMSTVSHDNKIAGVVSTHPAHVMNSGLESEFTVEVGLVGRVPCRVIGPITAGDRVVSSNRAGVAERLDMSKYQPGVIIGKALQSYSSTEVGTIEVVVGRL